MKRYLHRIQHPFTNNDCYIPVRTRLNTTAPCREFPGCIHLAVATNLRISTSKRSISDAEFP